tara:strand:+ start:1566 stop:2306 length:741 start_codon:yes stop_codon:yes gene_type:complete
MKEKNYESVSPFGPKIATLRLPPELVEDLNAFCEALDEDAALAESLDHSVYLVGKVNQEITIPNELIAPYADFFINAIEEYMFDIAVNIHMMSSFRDDDQDFKSLKDQAIRDNMTVRTQSQSGWIVRSVAGDYNPVHSHLTATLACVGYLRVPDWEDEIDEDLEGHSGPTHGCLQFHYGDQGELSVNQHTVMPRVGDFYLFPGWLQHTAYPFKSKGERRSFSINFAADMQRLSMTITKADGSVVEK